MSIVFKNTRVTTGTLFKIRLKTFTKHSRLFDNSPTESSLIPIGQFCWSTIGSSVVHLILGIGLAIVASNLS